MRYEVITAIVILILSVIFLIFWTCPSPTRGTLVLDSKDVCHGELHVKRLYSTSYTFKCDDGRTILNVTNFSIR